MKAVKAERIHFLHGHRHDVLPNDAYKGLTDRSGSHTLAYSVGAVHGLAGSGTLVLAVMTTMSSVLSGMFYLLIFGLGSVLGMLAASSLFSLPFLKRVSSNESLQVGLTLVSVVLCIGFGGKVIYENLFR